MDAIEAILTRRSIRKYTDRLIPDDMTRMLLDAAMSAPSARNTQSWHFIVIEDRKVLDLIPQVHPYADMVMGAPLAIVVCGDRGMEPNEGYLVQNCSAATQNLLIAANALGLGAVWLGVYPRKERVDGIRGLLDIPDGIVPISLVSIGYPAEESYKADRYDESKIHRDRW